MRTKNGSVRELIAGIQQAAEQEEYNPAEDLKTLQTQYKRLGKKDFGLMLDAMVEKYATGEYAAIHAALVEKARNGDIEAIKMSREMQASGGSDEVVIVDDVEYEYEVGRDGTVLPGYVDADNHHIDAVRYAVNRIWMRRGA
mgnify:CR=1 FL=1